MSGSAMSAPKLRFPGFVGEWEARKIGDFANVKTGSRDTQDRVDGGEYPFFVRSDTIERINSYAFEGEAILTSGDGVGVGKNIHYIDGRFDYHQRVYAIRDFSKHVDGQFFFQFFRENFLPRVMRLSAKNSVDSVRMSMITDMWMATPNLPEQKKISSFLGMVDAKIAALRARVLGLQAYKRGLMQALFSQTLRFTKPDGTAFPDWQEKKLNEVLRVKGVRNYEGKFDKSDVLSVSGECGIVNQIEHLGRSYAGALVDNYHVVDTGDIVYTKSPLKSNPYGIIKANRGRPGIVSTLYAVYEVREGNSFEYIDRYFELDENTNNYLAPLVHKGAKNDMKISNQRVLIDPISIPSFDEQAKIAEALSAMDAKIAAVQGHVDRMQDFKKGLLQQMFV